MKLTYTGRQEEFTPAQKKKLDANSPSWPSCWISREANGKPTSS